MIYFKTSGVLPRQNGTVFLVQAKKEKKKLFQIDTVPKNIVVPIFFFQLVNNRFFRLIDNRFFWY